MTTSWSSVFGAPPKHTYHPNTKLTSGFGMTSWMYRDRNLQFLGSFFGSAVYFRRWKRGVETLTDHFHLMWCWTPKSSSYTRITLPPIIMVQWKMGPSNIRFLSFGRIFHFHDYGIKVYIPDFLINHVLRSHGIFLLLKPFASICLW